MQINILKKGDRVLSVSSEIIVVERKDKTVDIIPIYIDGSNLRINTEEMITIGYGENIITTTTDEGVEITTF